MPVSLVDLPLLLSLSSHILFSRSLPFSDPPETCTLSVLIKGRGHQNSPPCLDLVPLVCVFLLSSVAVFL